MTKITIDRATVEQALEAWSDPQGMPELCKAMDAFRAALAEPVQEPVAFVNAGHLHGLTLGHYGYAEIYTDESAGRVPIYTAPPQPKPLSDDEIKELWVAYRAAFPRYLCFARALEAAYGIKEKE